MHWLVNVLLFLVTLLYPLLWLYDKQSSILLQLPWILSLLWFIKGFLQKTKQRFVAFSLAIFLAIMGKMQVMELMYWYPILINTIMLVVFATSLFTSQTIVERLARLTTPNLTLQGITYTRRVTQVWCGVFIFNLVVTFLLIITESYYYWAIYTGVISYIIIASVMLIEWLIRQKVKQRHG